MPTDPRPTQLDLFAAATPEPAPVEVPLPDGASRAFAVDPANHVVLEASAGTGKTTVLVRRYLALLTAGVDPRNVLAITFTRKAAAEMRERIVRELRTSAESSAEGRQRRLRLRDRLTDVSISTIDAFCLALLREFPLEADLDPSFEVADETEVARLVEDALDDALRITRARAGTDEDIALVFSQLSTPRARQGLRHLLDRRHVAPAALGRYLAGQPETTAAEAAVQAMRGAMDALAALPGGLEAFLRHGPVERPRFRLLAADLRALQTGPWPTPGSLRAVLDELRDLFLTKTGQPRQRPGGKRADFATRDGWVHHSRAIGIAGPQVERVLAAFDRALNAALARGVSRVFHIALDRYRRSLAEHDVVDFADALERAVRLLEQMDEFAQSRYRLESRYHHVLVDELQDTSRLQWRLVSLLVESWGEGFGLVHEAPLPPSIFVVGDRKQSIYRFRDAEVAVLDEAARFIAGLREHGSPRRSITHSFRARPELLTFVNDVFDQVDRLPERSDAFRYDETDRFPVALPAASTALDTDPVLGLVAAPDVVSAARAIAGEVARLLREGVVRDPQTGVRRTARPGDVAVLFRTRESHREIEEALEAQGIPTYVYKGLGFFETDEIKDLAALLRYLALPGSRARAAAFLRSRLVRLSDRGLLLLGEQLASALVSADLP
jgi:ATP-dependent helicase/nuclease subunit A